MAVKKTPSEKELAHEILKLETSGYRLSDNQGTNCRQQKDYLYIKSKAPYGTSEVVDNKKVIVDKLPTILSVNNDKSDEGLKWIEFKLENGVVDKMSFSLNSETIRNRASFANIIRSPETIYVRKECLRP